MTASREGVAAEASAKVAKRTKAFVRGESDWQFRKPRWLAGLKWEF